MSVYFDEVRQRWRWQFKATIDDQRHRLSRLLPRGWSEAQARRYDEQETARTYARLSTGKRVSTIPLIDVAVGLYLRERVPELRDGKNAALNLAHLLPHYTGRGLDELGKIARRYAEKQRGELAPATIRQRLATLRSAASYALKYHDLGSRDWIAAMPMPSVSNERHYYLRRDDVLRLARHIKDRPTRAWVLLTFATGSRPGELFRAEPAPDGSFFLMPETKNGDRAVKPVLPRFRRYARHWPMPHDYTWHSKLFREARAASGLDHIVAHDLRHSTASALHDAGATLSEVGKVLGHRTAQATNRYAHLYAEKQAELLAAIWQKRPHKRRIA